MRQKKELAALAALPDDQIDTSDIPELPPGAWKDAIRGRFYRPVKQAVSLRLDADVIAWLRKSGKGYQTRANRILRQSMLADIRRA
ncbi:MAG: BrnA antitoxin family protein [Candidatus Sulfotelmatobacter sp.]